MDSSMDWAETKFVDMAQKINDIIYLRREAAPIIGNLRKVAIFYFLFLMRCQTNKQTKVLHRETPIITTIENKVREQQYFLTLALYFS